VLSGGGPEPTLRREVLLLRREVQRLASRVRRIEAHQNQLHHDKSTTIDPSSSADMSGRAPATAGSRRA
jgi:hypothetical protein